MAIVPSRRASAEAKRDVWVRVTGDVEGVGILENGGVAVRRQQGREYQFAFGDGHAADGDVLACPARRRAFNWPIPAQAFFNSRANQRRVIVELLQLVAVLHQRQHPVADQIHGRLVSGDQQQKDHR